MKPLVIACRSMEKELLHLMETMDLPYDIHWVAPGLHNTPRLLTQHLQQLLDGISNRDTVLLAMSLCGNAVAGLRTGDFQLVIPRCEDCITLLLGSRERRKALSDTYFLTEGWLNGERNILWEHRHCLEKYGEVRGNRIFTSMFAHYRQLAVVDTGCFDVAAVKAEAEPLARALNLECTTLDGTLDFLQQLFATSWSRDRFLVVPPHSQVTLENYRVTVLPEGATLLAEPGANLLELLRGEGLSTDAPCGGNGTCGKCTVCVDGVSVQACQTRIHRDITVTLPDEGPSQILKSDFSNSSGSRKGYVLAFDIGTTSVAGSLLSGETGEELACAGDINPQVGFGADVISRIRVALAGQMEALTQAIRQLLISLADTLCREAKVSPDAVTCISIVGNPAMQQLFLGLSPENLACVPFAPILTRAESVAAAPYFPNYPDAQILIVPDISGYIGGDTMGCILSTGIYRHPEMTLLVDIGTNGEMVLGNRNGLIACSTAAGPALEGANIRFGMRGTQGAIDHVWLEQGEMKCSVIGGSDPKGICGSGLIDAVACALDAGWINHRGRIQLQNEINGQRVIPLPGGLYLTQDDIRQVQLAKGAIHAGIRLMVAELGISPDDIAQVLLAGAFGNYMTPASACRIGLLPPELAEKITPVGNAALKGAQLLACHPAQLTLTQELLSGIRFLELASLQAFSVTFARCMGFPKSAKIT